METLDETANWYAYLRNIFNGMNILKYFNDHENKNNQRKYYTNEYITIYWPSSISILNHF